jgi:hypothetical protein
MLSIFRYCTCAIPGGAGVSLVFEGVWNTLKATEAAWLTLLRDDVMRRQRYRCNGLQLAD